MDKTFAFTLIGLFTVCACTIMWAALGGPKRNRVYDFFAYGYIAFMWICVIGLTILTVIE